MSCLSISQAASAVHDLYRGVLNIKQKTFFLFFFLQHPSPTSYGLLGMVLVKPAGLRAARG